MSTETGDKAVANAMLDQGRALVAGARREAEQLQFVDPLTADELFDAQEALGPGAGTVSVMREAQKRRGGRKPGSRNRRTDDFAKYILGFGQDPAITLMQIQATPPEELVARSELLDPVKRRMSLADATALRVRCAEALMPYIHGKKPIAIDLSSTGDFNLLVPGVNITAEDARAVAEGTFVFAEEAEFEELSGEGAPDDA